MAMDRRLQLLLDEERPVQLVVAGPQRAAPHPPALFEVLAQQRQPGSLGAGGLGSPAALYLAAQSFGGAAAPAPEPRTLGEQTSWWSLTADDEIFRRRPAAGGAAREPMAAAI